MIKTGKEVRGYLATAVQPGVGGVQGLLVLPRARADLHQQPQEEQKNAAAPHAGMCLCYIAIYTYKRYQ